MINRLARVPDPQLPSIDVGDSVDYLASDDAQRSLADDAYWPKWHSPWWHALLLFELGEARRIPPRAARGIVDALNALPLKIFPIAPGDAPDGYDPRRDISCHCALGCMAQVLIACGVDVARELPWVKPWFVRYQMADGGLSCDEHAYRVAGECPSSMVGTIAPLEAMLLLADTAEEHAFVDRAAQFLVERRLTRGSPTVHNAEERTREPSWFALAFPRFYFYDVLRGLAALVRYTAARQDRRLSTSLIGPVVDHLLAAFPDGVVRVQRRVYAGAGSMVRVPGGWERVPTSTTFPLLERTSEIGMPSVALTRQWSATRNDLHALAARGQLSQ